MAGDWIKMRVGLSDEPEVISIADKLELDEDTVCGKLLRLWGWADQKTEDGNAVGVTKKWIDRYLGVAGFAEALVAVGWLEAGEGGVAIPRFEVHMSQSAKRRALTSKRVARHKATKSNGASVTTALPREEKRREEKTSDVDVVGAADFSDGELSDISHLSDRILSVIPAATEADVSLVLKSAAAVVRGRLPRDALEVVLESVRKENPRKPIAYFHRAMSNQAKQRGSDFRQILKTTPLPALEAPE